jgi:hypothetical protein
VGSNAIARLTGEASDSILTFRIVARHAADGLRAIHGKYSLLLLAKRTIPVIILFSALTFTSCASEEAGNRLMIRNASLAPTLVPTEDANTSDSAPIGISGTDAGTNNENVLHDAVLSYSGLDQIVKENGIPDAIEIYFAQSRIALYYRNPSRTFIYQKPFGANLREITHFDVVPRTAERLGFREGPLPPPWPITIPPADASLLATPRAPMLPEAIHPENFAKYYGKDSTEARSKVAEVKHGISFDRAATALMRLNPSARLPGFNWQLVIVDSPCNLILGVPDGTLFISDGFVVRLSDDELAAIIAHELGHEAYGHNRNWWREAGPVKKTAAVIGATVVVAALLLGTGAGYGSLPGGGPVYFLGYTEQQEIEANYMAVRYLAAINIAPDTLFDALTKLTPSACMSSEPVDSFAYLADWGVNHHPGRSGEDLGKMLDAGVIVLPQAHAR